MQAIHDTRTLHLQVCITGMHLLKRFGHTARIVQQDNWPEVFRVRMQSDRDSAAEQALALGRGIEGIARQLKARQTDIVVVLGDRIEALAGALAGSLSNLPVAHIHGGELATGQHDDAMRHAISKIAHLHLAATAEASQRLARMGEPKWRIKRVGAPALDVLRQIPVPDSDWIEDLLGMPAPDGFVIVAQHPATADASVEKRHMTATLQAVSDFGLPALLIWPNTDPGHSGILAALEQSKGAFSGAFAVPLQGKIVRSIPHQDFLKALLSASTIVGNSSAGIIEAPAAGTPTINIGPRQAGRLRDPITTIDCPYSLSAIRRALQRARLLKQRLHPHRSTPYGDGRASARIARYIEQLRITNKLVHKQNSY